MPYTSQCQGLLDDIFEANCLAEFDNVADDPGVRCSLGASLSLFYEDYDGEKNLKFADNPRVGVAFLYLNYLYFFGRLLHL